MGDHVVQAVLTLAMWFTLWALWYPLNRVGAAIGWRIGRWQLARMHELHDLQVSLMLLRSGAGPLMVAAAMEAGRERRLEW